MYDLQIYHNPMFGDIRTAEENGKPLFCAKDVAKALGYVDTVNAIKQHCRGVALYHPIKDALGRQQDARFIPEGDVYRLITHSKLPAAVTFEHWVFDNVLPRIRTAGGYTPRRWVGPEEILTVSDIVRLTAISAGRIRGFIEHHLTYGDDYIALHGVPLKAFKMDNPDVPLQAPYLYAVKKTAMPKLFGRAASAEPIAEDVPELTPPEPLTLEQAIKSVRDILDQLEGGRICKRSR